MQPESFHEIEQKLCALTRPNAADALRAAVLDDAQRELRAARWDRRLARTAIAVVLAGITINATVGLVPPHVFGWGSSSSVAAGPWQRRLEATAMGIANLVDPGSSTPSAEHLMLSSQLALGPNPWAAYDEAVSSGIWPLARRDADSQSNSRERVETYP